MNFDLKNFPIGNDPVAMMRWKRGFEKELRKMKNKYHYKTCQVCRDWVKEILGE